MTGKKELACLDTALRLFHHDFNCAESVFSALAEYLAIDSPLVPRVSSGFGGGIARSQSLCGAVSGAIMALGLKYGRDNAADDRKIIYGRVQELLKGFTAHYGTLQCRELVGVDFTDTAAMQQKGAQLHEECARYVRTAVELALRLMQE